MCYFLVFANCTPPFVQVTFENFAKEGLGFEVLQCVRQFLLTVLDLFFLILMDQSGKMITKNWMPQFPKGFDNYSSVFALRMSSLLVS